MKGINTEFGGSFWAEKNREAGGGRGAYLEQALIPKAASIDRSALAVDVDNGSHQGERSRWALLGVGGNARRVPEGGYTSSEDIVD